MSRLMHPAAEMRSEPRLKLPAMYTLLRLRLAGQAGYPMMGHIYDVSLNGIRFELDEALVINQVVEMRIMLPGANHVQFKARGRVVRMVSEADEPGPVRMALVFTGFATALDEHRLKTYLTERGLYAQTEAQAA